MLFPFEFGETVLVDKDETAKGIVTAFEYRDKSITVEIAYFLNGEPKSFWFPLWRVSKCIS